MSKGRRKHLTVIRKKRTKARADMRRSLAAFQTSIRDTSEQWSDIDVQPITSSKAKFSVIGTRERGTP